MCRRKPSRLLKIIFIQKLQLPSVSIALTPKLSGAVISVLAQDQANRRAIENTIYDLRMVLLISMASTLVVKHAFVLSILTHSTTVCIVMISFCMKHVLTFLESNDMCFTIINLLCTMMIA